jgi:DnaJ-class molecular chaperone
MEKPIIKHLTEEDIKEAVKTLGKICPECAGTGWTSNRTYTVGVGGFTTTNTCPNCEGSGKNPNSQECSK